MSVDGRVIFNRTESAPVGVYWRQDRLPEKGEWAVVSADAASPIWIADNGYLAHGWPILKRVVGVPGDEVCRTGQAVTINGKYTAVALIRDGAGDDLPAWRGCFVVGHDAFFLLNDHPHSLDGRYFGATKIDDVRGRARLLFQISN